MPGIKKHSFEIFFAEDCFKNRDIIKISIKDKLIIQFKLFVRWIGIFKSYQLQIISDPILEEDEDGDGVYRYRVKPLRRFYHVFYIRVFKKKIDNLWD